MASRAMRPVRPFRSLARKSWERPTLQTQRTSMTTSVEAGRSLRVAIMGAGPGGLCMAIQLKKAGFENIVILEKAGGVANR